MIRKVILTAVVVAFATPAAGQNLLETRQQYRERQSSENYQAWRQTYRNTAPSAPLGGYPTPLGQGSPYGEHRPGYSRNYGYDTTDRRSPDYNIWSGETQ